MVEPASLLEILRTIEAELERGADSITLRVLDPDHGRGRFAGETVEVEGVAHVHRPWRVWFELGERLGLRLGTPTRIDESPLCELRFERLDPPTPAGLDVVERYGIASEFARIRKHEEPIFVLDFADALARINPKSDSRILSLGVNTGDELELLFTLRPELCERATVVGIDHNQSVLARARERFPDPRHEFVEADLARLPELAAIHPSLGQRFDLVLALDVLQSPGVAGRELVHRLVRDLLASTGGLILGLPNCRYRDGELIHGARMKNFAQPELSLLVADIAHYRRYLHQHRRKVFVTGKHEVLITAISA